MGASEARTVELEFDPDRLTVGEDADLRQGLSGVTRTGDHLWLACDEGCRIERLTGGAPHGPFASHRVFPLDDLLTLPASAREEADIEGLDVDDGWLWLVGSHSVKRKKPKPDDSPATAAKKLATTTRDGNRHLLARIPLQENELVREHGGRHAAALRATPVSSDLLDAIVASDTQHADPHLAPFVALPGKDNGLDIEGLAARGMRLFVGLRGPVLREWCCVLDLLLEADGDWLRLVNRDPGAQYRKHFLKLNGLGVRDLLIVDDDLLVLAGPSMAHDGPHEIWRWKGGAKAESTSALTDLERLLVLPQREGVDRAEGFVLFDDGPGAASVLVVFDTPSRERMSGDSAVKADLYRIP